ncbi:hypothetical protein [Holospora curviuscula]|nr:hypothetical protein [Holospora curviuscula]
MQWIDAHLLPKQDQFYTGRISVSVMIVSFFLLDYSAYGQIGMGNPFSFQVDGVDFSKTSTPDEKVAWAKLVDQGMDKIKAAQHILKKREHSKLPPHKPS